MKLLMGGVGGGGASAPLLSLSPDYNILPVLLSSTSHHDAIPMRVLPELSHHLDSEGLGKSFCITR